MVCRVVEMFKVSVGELWGWCIKFNQWVGNIDIFTDIRLINYG